MSQIRVNINGIEINTHIGYTISEVAEQNGISIPTLCHDDKLKHFGSCGMCVVEIVGNPKLIRSCSTQIADGMVIRTQTDRVMESRKTTLELLLSDHKGDCKAPCTLNCPSNVDIQGYVGLSANKEFNEALKLIKEDLPLPASIGRVCPHPCQTACRRGIIDDGISIAWIKRYVADLDLAKEESYQPEIAPSTGKKVAVIGGGPSGLSAAFFLRKAGHDVVIYEAMPEFGGMLKYGIPLYRLPKDVLLQEVKLIEKMGVKLIPNTRIGRDITLDHIRKNSDAVYVSIGAWKSSYIHCKGIESKGIIGGIEFLNAFAVNDPIRTGNRIAVIGGGNTAMDACRTAIRLGAKEVYAIYRRTKDDMPAVDIEIVEAEEEGVTFKFLSNPVEFISDADGNVVQMKLEKMAQGEVDATGRRKVVPTGEFETLDIDSVIMSVGQKLAPEGFEAIALNDWGNIKIQKGTYETNLDGVFAGGDAVENGAGIAIEAIADGKHAAVVIGEYLRGESFIHRHFYTVKKEGLTPESFPNAIVTPASHMGHEHPEIRMHNFEEVVHGYTNDEAVYESSRCLECGCMDSFECDLLRYTNDFEVNPDRFAAPSEELPIDDAHPFFIRDSNKCILCGMCVRICDEVMDLGVLGFSERGFDTTVKPAFNKTFEEANCVACGQCINVCPVGALQEKALAHKPVPVRPEITESICPECGLGCSLTLESKGSLLLRSLPSKGSEVDKGLLCRKGRFDLVENQTKERLTNPMVRKNGKLEEVSWEEAILYTARKAQSIYLIHGVNSLATMVSAKYYNESIYMLKKLSNDFFNTEYVYAIKGYQHGLKDILGYDASTNVSSELENTDLVLTIGTDIMQKQLVLGVRICKHTHDGVELIVINDKESKADEWANNAFYTENDLSFLKGVLKELANRKGVPPKATGFDALITSLKEVSVSEEAKFVANRLIDVKNAMIVFDRDLLSDEAIMLIAQIAVVSGHIGSARNGLIQLRSEGNSQGLVDLGVNMHTEDLYSKIETNEVKGLIVMNANDVVEIPKPLEFLVVQEETLSDLGRRADVVLPSPTHLETSGTMTSQDRKIQRVNHAVKSEIKMSGIEQIQQIMKIFGNHEHEVPIDTLLENIGKSIPEYLHSHEEIDKKDIFWPVNKSRILYEDGYATEDSNAKLQAVEDGIMYVPKKQIVTTVSEEAN